MTRDAAVPGDCAHRGSLTTARLARGTEVRRRWGHGLAIRTARPGYPAAPPWRRPGTIGPSRERTPSGDGHSACRCEARRTEVAGSRAQPGSSPGTPWSQRFRSPLTTRSDPGPAEPGGPRRKRLERCAVARPFSKPFVEPPLQRDVQGLRSISASLRATRTAVSGASGPQPPQEIADEPTRIPNHRTRLNRILELRNPNPEAQVRAKAIPNPKLMNQDSTLPPPSSTRRKTTCRTPSRPASFFCSIASLAQGPERPGGPSHRSRPS